MTEKDDNRVDTLDAEKVVLPDTKDVRWWWVEGSTFTRQLAGAQFDRWLNRVRAEAWDEGAIWAVVEITGDDRYTKSGFLAPGDNPYRDG